MRLAHCPVLLLAALALSACARDMPRYAAATAPGERSELDAMMYGAPAAASATVRRAAQALPAALFEAGGAYTLDAGDRLRVVVFGQDALSNSYAVDAAGQITLPLIGPVLARGLTTTQLAGAIAAKLRQNFIRDPSVAVEVEVYRPFFVLGEVAYPGQYPYVPHITLEKAIAIAGGFTPRAQTQRVIVKRNVGGETALFAMPLGYPLRPGDTVTVKERWF
jgi:polysaccharide export outer membrane protein